MASRSTLTNTSNSLRFSWTRAAQPADHGTHLGGDDAGHAVHAVRGEQLHGGNGAEVAQVRAVVRRGEQVAGEHELAGGEAGPVGEDHVVLREALPGGLRGGDHHGAAGAEAQGEDRAEARGEAAQRGVDGSIDEVEMAEERDGRWGRRRLRAALVALVPAIADLA
jgi:hypothetical protein